jgi:tRNA-specific adenosine deaminase 2
MEKIKFCEKDEENDLTEKEILSFINEAIEECNNALKAGEVPVGCVFLYLPSKKIIARGHNLTNKTGNATTHAEINCIKYIYSILNNELLKEEYIKKYEIKLEKDPVSEIFNKCALFVSCEPCIMCAYALSLVSKFSILNFFL